MRKADKEALYDHELNTWIRKVPDQQNTYFMGLTDWSQGYMGTINGIEFHVHLDELVDKDTLIATCTTDKITTEIHLPVAARMIHLNTHVLKDPSLINKDCYHEGWLFQIIIEQDEDIGSMKDVIWYEGAINSFFRKGD